MGLIHIMERGGEDEYRFKKALKAAKYAINEICELSDKMEEEYGYSERMSRRGYSRRDDMEDRREWERSGR
jgi:hypothetical protein